MDMSGQVYAPVDLPTGKELGNPLNMRPGGPQDRSGLLGERQIPCPYWDSNPGSSGTFHSTKIPFLKLKKNL